MSGTAPPPPTRDGTASDAFKKVTTGIWNITATLGLLAGGIWTLVTFSTLGQRQRAEFETRKLQAEAESLRMEPSVSLEVFATPVSDPTTNACVLDVKTTVKNNGTGSETISIDGRIPPIAVSKVRFDSNGALTGGDVLRAGLYVSGAIGPVPADGIFVMPGETRQWTTPISLKEPGLYLVIVSLRRPPPEQDQAHHTGMPRGTQSVWSASTLATVPPNRVSQRMR